MARTPQKSELGVASQENMRDKKEQGNNLRYLGSEKVLKSRGSANHREGANRNKWHKLIYDERS